MMVIYRFHLATCRELYGGITPPNARLTSFALLPDLTSRRHSWWPHHWYQNLQHCNVDRHYRDSWSCFTNYLALKIVPLHKALLWNSKFIKKKILSQSTKYYYHRRYVLHLMVYDIESTQGCTYQL